MRTRVRRRSPWRRRLRMFVIIVEIAVLFVLAVALGVIGGTFYSVSKYLPSNIDVASYKPTEVTKVFSSDGVLLADVFEENREIVSIDEIPKHLQEATVAIEDERFYQHSGVDIRGISRAVYQNLRRGRAAQGGSTITQQLARNIYLTREKKLSRKLQEIVLAIQLERHYSKQQILELYLNEVYYGSGAYGVQTASRIYFGKHVKDLTIAESALLAGLTQRPSAYSPHDDKDRAIRRRNAVLDRMAALDYITAEERDKAKDAAVKLVGLSPRGMSTWKAPWFVTYVIKEMTDRYDSELVYRGGLRIHTTLNYEMQQHAEETLRNGIAGARHTGIRQGALVSIDPHTGHIKAMVGGVGTDFVKDQFNRAAQARRGPGSAFKTFVYAAAIDNGYSTDYRVSNAPIMYRGKPWPRNHSSAQSAASYTMKQAMAQSINRCAVQMARTVGIEQVITYCRMLGIGSPLSPNLATAIGASVVTPLEMCSAYGVFAANGIHTEPTCVVRINSSHGGKDGVLIDEFKPSRRQVLSEQTAKGVNELLRAVVTSGTGRAASRVKEAYGKTGTHEDRDVWFVGFTPELVTAVWGGNDDNAPLRRAYGGGVCTPIWTTFMLKAVPIQEKESPRPKPEEETGTPRQQRTPEREPPREETQVESAPDGDQVAVVVCTESGLVATAACPGKHRATFEPGTEPITTCPLHRPDVGDQRPTAEQPRPSPQPATPATRTAPQPQPGRPPATGNGDRYVTVTICVDSGQIANMYCPETIPRRYRVDEAPSRGCRLHRPPTD